MDPVLTDIDNGDYTPQEGSPVIDAGDPAYQDPDGSIADIGMLYFDWGTEAPVINSINVDNQIGTSPLVVQFSSDISGPANTRLWPWAEAVRRTFRDHDRPPLWSSCIPPGLSNGGPCPTCRILIRKSPVASPCWNVTS